MPHFIANHDRIELTEDLPEIQFSPNDQSAHVDPDERIQRHLMRQRGAGSRAVNADFGFSFAGFSAPSSQDATPSEIPEGPVAKRRKTVADDAGRELVNVGPAALDRRGKTKAARAKRRFADVEDTEQTRTRAEGDGSGDDSFVAGVAVKRRTQGARPGPKERAADVHDGLEHHHAGMRRDQKADGLASVTKAKRRGKKAADPAAAATVSALADPIEPAAVTKQKSAAKKRMPRRVKQAAASDAGISPKKDAEIVAPTSRRKTTGRTKKQAPEKSGEEATSQDTESATEQHDVEPPEPSQLAVPEPTRKRKGNGEGDQKPSACASRKRALSVLHEDDGTVDQPGPFKQPRKAAAKTTVATKMALDCTPPQLERRPLQEADVNRSPSPRKSPEKLENDVKAQGNGLVKSSKRKCKKTLDDRTLAEGGLRTSRKLLGKQDEPSAGTAGVDAAPEVLDTAEGFLTVPGSPQAQDVVDMEPELQPPLKTRKAAKTARTRKVPNVHEPQLSTKFPTEAPACTTSQQQQGYAEDEDVDWLFTAPETKRKAVAKAPSAKPPAVPRKTKLADIDLDDLLANVAAFAQSGNPGPITSSACINSRKPRRR